MASVGGERILYPENNCKNGSKQKSVLDHEPHKGNNVFAENASK